MSLRSSLYRNALGVYLRAKGIRSAETYRFLMKSQWHEPEQIRAIQHEALGDLIAYVYECVPYYRRVMEERGLEPGDIRTTDDLIAFPVLTKDTFRKHWNELVSTRADSLKTNIRRTGGSTGEPLQLMNDYSAASWESAASMCNSLSNA